MKIRERRDRIGGLEVSWREAGDAPVLYLHGVPTASFDWIPFLERGGGVAPDLPGFGNSAKPAEFDYSIDGYADFLERFVDTLGLERLALVVHDWGAVGLALAQPVEGHVAVAVVRVLRENGEHELVHGGAVSVQHGAAVLAPQAVADGEQPPAVGALGHGAKATTAWYQAVPWRSASAATASETSR